MIVYHGAVYFYVWLLHGVFRLLGNYASAGIWVQIVRSSSSSSFPFRFYRSSPLVDPSCPEGSSSPDRILLHRFAVSRASFAEEKGVHLTVLGALLAMGMLAAGFLLDRTFSIL